MNHLDRGTASGQTLARLLVPGSVWIVRAVLLSRGGVPHAAIASIDLVLIILHLWANTPLRRQDPARFDHTTSVTGILMVPVLLAAYFFLCDSWRTIRELLP